MAQSISVPIFAHTLVGSTYICGEGADIDLLILVPDLKIARDSAALNGFHIEGEESYDTSTFYSARKGDLNVLITANMEFFRLFRAAAQICRHFRVSDKKERIAVHRLLMDDEDLPGA